MSETVTMTPTDFLLARIAEREAFWSRQANDLVMGGIAEQWIDECEAKRRIVDWAAPKTGRTERVPTDRPGIYDTQDVRHISDDGADLLALLALPYADHHDYRQEWKP